MIVCSCHAVTDREIRRLARAGASSLRQIAEACGAGTGCGGCRPVIRAILVQVEARRRERESGPAIAGAPTAPEAA